MDSPTQTSEQAKSATSNNLHPISLTKESLAIYKKKWRQFIGLILLTIISVIPFSLLLGFVLYSAISLFSKGDPWSHLPEVLLLSGGVILAYCVLVCVLLIYQLAQFILAGDTGNMSISTALRTAAKKFLPYLWVSFIAGFIIGGGFFLFIIPGIIFTLWFCLATYIVLFEGVTGMNALLTSKEYMNGKILRSLVAVIVLFLLLFALFAVPQYLVDYSGTTNSLTTWVSIYSLIMQLLIGPFVTIYLVVLYRRLKEAHIGPVVLGKKSPYILTAVAGYILQIVLVVGLIVVLGQFITGYLNRNTSSDYSSQREEQTKDGDDSLFAKQFAQANDVKRRTDTTVILNAIAAYRAEKRKMPEGITKTPTAISSTGADLCSLLIPDYMSEFPVDPLPSLDASITDCSEPYDTGYLIWYAENKTVPGGISITVSAPKTQVGDIIKMTN